MKKNIILHNVSFAKNLYKIFFYKNIINIFI